MPLFLRCTDLAPDLGYACGRWVARTLGLEQDRGQGSTKVTGVKLQPTIGSYYSRVVSSLPHTLMLMDQ